VLQAILQGENIVHLHTPATLLLRNHPTLNITYGRDSIVIETRYWLDGPWFEIRCGRDFPYLFIPVLRLTQPSPQWTSDFLFRIKRLSPTLS